jgi:hypothetical protein
MKSNNIEVVMKGNLMMVDSEPDWQRRADQVSKKGLELAGDL